MVSNYYLKEVLTLNYSTCYFQVQPSEKDDKNDNKFNTLAMYTVCHNSHDIQIQINITNV